MNIHKLINKKDTDQMLYFQIVYQTIWGKTVILCPAREVIGP